jgi:putative heme-binding domain-containing protein
VDTDKIAVHTVTVKVWLGAAGLAAAAALAAAQESAPAAAALERGHRLFDVHCARCHGVGGGGGEGPALTRPLLRRAPDDETLIAVIQEGIPRTAMTGSFALSRPEAADVAGYVRSLGRVARQPVTGDPARGRAVYDDNGCAACHIVAGEGRGLGPELTAVGAVRGADHLRQSVLDAAAAVDDAHRVLTARTNDGRSVRGVRIAEDEFSVVLRDADFRLHSFTAAELADLRREMGASLMPSYATRLERAEVEDLVAYLVSLVGEER